MRFDAAHRAVYASNASNYRQVPIGAVVPRSIEELVEAVATCRRHEAAILMRGGGTLEPGRSLGHAVVFDVSKHCNRILDLDPASRFAIVEPGVVCDTLRDAAERHGLTLKAKVHLVASSAKRVLLILGYPDIYLFADARPEFDHLKPIAALHNGAIAAARDSRVS